MIFLVGPLKFGKDWAKEKNRKNKNQLLRANADRLHDVGKDTISSALMKFGNCTR